MHMIITAAKLPTKCYYKVYYVVELQRFQGYRGSRVLEVLGFQDYRGSRVLEVPEVPGLQTF